MALPNAIEVVTLFVDDITKSKTFYSNVFQPTVIYQDAVSCVLKFDGAMVNILQASNAPTLVQPAAVAPAASGVRLAKAKTFYSDVFQPTVIYQDGKRVASAAALSIDASYAAATMGACLAAAQFQGSRSSMRLIG